MMEQYRYRITVEPLAASDIPLCFEAASHDDILELARATRRGAFNAFDADTAAALTVGLKLLGGVLLRHRRHPLFEAFHPHFGQFMKRLKGAAAPERPIRRQSVEWASRALAACGRVVERLFDATRC